MQSVMMVGAGFTQEDKPVTQTYFGYEVYDLDGSGVCIGVDLDPALLWERLQEDILTIEEGIEAFFIGKVEANSVDDAINKIHSGNWDYKGFQAKEGGGIRN